MTNESNAKVTVTKEVAEAIEYLRSEYEVYREDSYFIEAHAIYRSPHMDASWTDRPILNEVPTAVFASAVLNGYTVEKSPEEKVREYYDRCRTNLEEAEINGRAQRAKHWDGQAIGASITLDILGISIEGVNA